MHRKPLLWGKQHHAEEYRLLVASRTGSDQLRSGAVPISFVLAAVPVQYKVKDLYAFIYNHNEPEKLLESICYRELTKFAASASIEVDDAADLENSLLGAGRAKAKKILTEKIQTAADEIGLGVEIVFLGLQEVYPPPEVAVDYQKVLGAIQQRQALILKSRAYRNRILTLLAGSIEEVDELYGLAGKYQQARQQNDTEKIQELGPRIDRAFEAAKGEIFSTLRLSKSSAFEKSILAKATGQRFASQVKAFRAAGNIYKHQQRLAVFEEAMDDIRKFIVVADPQDSQVFIVDMQEKLTPSLYELSGLEE
jgi:regulator of protease activity HflC (stomatin/prohibitin superfamily)